MFSRHLSTRYCFLSNNRCPGDTETQLFSYIVKPRSKSMIMSEALFSEATINVLYSVKVKASNTRGVLF